MTASMSAFQGQLALALLLYGHLVRVLPRVGQVWLRQVILQVALRWPRPSLSSGLALASGPGSLGSRHGALGSPSPGHGFPAAAGAGGLAGNRGQGCPSERRGTSLGDSHNQDRLGEGGKSPLRGSKTQMTGLQGLSNVSPEAQSQ